MSGGERSLAGTAGSYVPSTPADWPSPPPTTIQDGLDDIAAGEVLSAQSLVWTSESTPPAGGNVFHSWATVAAAIASLKGQKTVTCVGSGLHVTSGTWPGITDVVFVAGGDTPIELEIIVDDGAIWTGTQAVTQREVSFISENTHNLVTLTGTEELRWNLESNSENALSGPGIALVAAAGTSVMISNLNSGVWGAGSLSAQGGSVNILAFNDSGVSADAFDASSTGGTVLVIFDASSANGVFHTQNAGPAYTFQFAGVNNFKQAFGQTGTGTGTVTVTTAAIIAVASGSMDVTSSVSGETSGAATVTAQLLRDAGNIGDPVSVTVGAAAAFTLAPMFIDTAPDAAGHTYGLKVTTSAGTIAVSATGAQIKVKELT